MKLSNLKPAKGAVHSSKRLGRGEGSTTGGTAGRGHKGAKSRSGNSKKIGFEGGQMPLQRRLPKYGFTNFNRVEYKPLNLDALQVLAEKSGVKEITIDLLRSNGLISKNDKVKILGRGELKAVITVKAHAFSATAIAAIEKNGGKAEKI
ncbi:MAG: 50S ribosomal protein L15 [Flavobacteriales bacterium]|nr:50S ribosomal protein L15 [Flavobacteriales bacterium]MCZ2443357.1 50S ribosomal protein L15 [Flavobacteriales bacterium]